MNKDNPFANYFEDQDDDDKTMVSPEPKLTINKPQGIVISATPETLPLAQDNPIMHHAWSLLSLVAHLRNSPSHPDIASLRLAMIQEIKQFDSNLQKHGVSLEQQQAARYALCTLIDETVLNTTWGCNSIWSTQSLLITFHKEAWGGEKFFLILKHCLQQVQHQWPLLELLYFCLCLGFEGKYRIQDHGLSKLEEVRENVFRVLQQQKGDAEKDLSIHWRGLEYPQHPLTEAIPFWQVATASLALILVTFLGFWWSINSNAEPLLNRLRDIQKSFISPVAPELKTPVANDTFKQLQGFLEPEIRQGLITLEQSGDKTVLRIVGKGFFASGSDQVVPQYQPLLTKITQALSDVPNNILVVGHTDNTRMASKRFPSNWELSKARAGVVALALLSNPKLAGKVTFEGKADTQPLVANDTLEHKAMNRRVEIIF